MKKQYLLFLFSLCIIFLVGMIWYFYPSEKTNINPSISSEISSLSKSDEKEKSGTNISIDSSIPTGSRNTETNTHSGFIFKKPNTEWKSRDVTLNDGRTIHYVFGEGNPKEVALDKDGINILAKKCEDSSQNQELYNSESCDGDPSGIGHPLYMYPEVEKSLLSALSDPDWEKIFTNCSANFSVIAKDWGLSDAEILEPFSSGFLDMENLISINRATGRKSLDQYRIGSTIGILEKIVDAPCGRSYGINIIQQLQSAKIMYRIPD